MASKDPEMIDNPAYSVPRVTESHRRADLSRIVMQTESKVQEEEDQQKTGESSKWDHHITLAVVITLVSLLLLNPLSFAFGLCGVFFAYKARQASREHKYLLKIENERTSYAFVIVSLLILIIISCGIGFTVYLYYCGKTGAACETRTHV